MTVIEHYQEIQDQLAELFRIAPSDLKHRLELIRLSSIPSQPQFVLVVFAIMVGVLDRLELEGKRTIDCHWWAEQYMNICGYDRVIIEKFLREWKKDGEDKRQQ